MPVAGRGGNQDTTLQGVQPHLNGVPKLIGQVVITHTLRVPTGKEGLLQ